jgi:hypothetical protein
MKFVNLTPHEVVLVPVSGGEVRIPPAGVLARCYAERRVVDIVVVEGVEVPVNQVILGKIADLPAPEAGVAYIVSLQVAQRAAKEGRVDDLFVPDESVRDEAGRIIGCRCLARQEPSTY